MYRQSSQPPSAGASSALSKPDHVSTQEFVREELEYYERQASKTRRGFSGHLQRMHAFYQGLARHRRLLLQALLDGHREPADISRH
jgi:hypothetical protein